MELPSKDTSEIIANLATAAGIVLCGAWAFWKWSLSEYLRRRKEIPSFDGEIAARGVSIAPRTEAVTVSCRWRNCGSVPLDVNTQETRVSVYSLPDTAALGPIGPRLKNIPEVCVRRPWEHWPRAILEPDTTSEIQAHFVLGSGQAYVFACRLEAVAKNGDDKQVWVRELIWKSAAPVTVATEPNNAMHATCEDARA